MKASQLSPIKLPSLERAREEAPTRAYTGHYGAHPDISFPLFSAVSSLTLVLSPLSYQTFASLLPFIRSSQFTVLPKGLVVVISEAKQ